MSNQSNEKKQGGRLPPAYFVRSYFFEGEDTFAANLPHFIDLEKNQVFF